MAVADHRDMEESMRIEKPELEKAMGGGRLPDQLCLSPGHRSEVSRQASTASAS
jgi:hypothetical protein